MTQPTMKNRKRKGALIEKIGEGSPLDFGRHRGEKRTGEQSVRGKPDIRTNYRHRREERTGNNWSAGT